MKILEGKVAYITGGTRGIGKGIALLFAEQGADIIYTSAFESDDVDDLQSILRKMGVKAKFLIYDASSFKGTENAMKEAFNEFGRIDILVNNAGITRDTLLMRMSESDWDMVMNVNLKSVFNHTKAVQTYMLKQRFGSIINMASIVGLQGNAGQANYAASKAGIIGFTKSVAKEVGSRNIRVNAIAPGFIATDMTAILPEDMRREWTQKISLRRVGTVEDIANTALFLASELSSYITGHVLSCDGGM
ncbi:MAG: 3-oxoacyl-[acyl-carrier-protein] reductase [Bacteroidales bacterium]|jgi:3-oxoacyl-[acyl-carrier protein] reductase|nr:3-oxoacyl-[acyl-carrier-protein] reductase [Bacteroidales bacterium]